MIFRTVKKESFKVIVSQNHSCAASWAVSKMCLLLIRKSCHESSIGMKNIVSCITSREGPKFEMLSCLG